ncbi:hypothetical protein GCM10008171_08330 [Methylopila jiangsuensis]|uniref:LTXXQ motif family protein n=1 Tax=Methylopila jiangsuensis TaxID=586230 RepID=A0A9W6N251_9HYPH|nr:hypothetical protein [Methylopila jiangsuensis]MDR6285821.1 hypothetical protein [Methylopila jiangsuensis]GLK75579.1 hypothetical protein GCM10008171_08330 [Methylopila jiangsuensis]
MRLIRPAVLAAALALGAAGGPAAFAQEAPAAGPKTPLPAPTPRAVQPGQGKQADHADWPCVQPRVAELSYGQMWAGPPLDAALTAWRDDALVRETIPTLVARRTKTEEAETVLRRFAHAAGADKNAKLTLLFAGVFSEINASRSAVIAGIERYARKQRDLSERIKTESLQLASDRKGKDMAAQMSPELQQKEQTLTWDTRIYDERAQALTYVCESPVILEQLAFERGRAIQALMD